MYTRIGGLVVVHDVAATRVTKWLAESSGAGRVCYSVLTQIVRKRALSKRSYLISDNPRSVCDKALDPNNDRSDIWTSV